MKILNFVSGGQTGDLLHQLYIVKSICDRENALANLYIVDSSYGLPACGDFSLDLNSTFLDTEKLINLQSYINFYGILPRDFTEEYINLNLWRHHSFTSWTELLSNVYNLETKKNYIFLNIDETLNEYKSSIIIHNSKKRHNTQFNWNDIINNYNEDIIFLTTNKEEYDAFRFKNDKIKLKVVDNIYDMAKIIFSCKLFIGNQSMPFALASGLDVPRICELYHNSYEFYIGEERYSDNISWFNTTDQKHNSNNCIIHV